MNVTKFALRIFLVLSASGGMTPLVCSAGETSPSVPPLKDFVLCAAAQLSVQTDRELSRVIDVSKNSFVVGNPSRHWAVPMDRDPRALQVNYSLELTDVKAQIDSFGIQRVYTPSNDPARQRALEAVHVGIAMQDSLTLAQHLDDHANGSGIGWATVTHLGFAGRSSPTTPAQEAEQLKAHINGGWASGAEQSHEIAKDLVQELYDAIEVTLKLSAPKPLDHPYVLLIVRFRSPGVENDEVRNWVYAKELPPIGASPQSISIRQGGFPKGFQIVTSQVHLYDHGRAVATNLSTSRTDLTREEAPLYAKIDYMGAHKGETLPPSLALSPFEIRAAPRRVEAGERSIYYLRISKDGIPLGCFLDTRCTQRVQNADTLRRLEALRFFPALDKGVAVEGQVAVDLAGFGKS